MRAKAKRAQGGKWPVKTKFLLGNVLDMLKLIPSNSIHMAMTSPPYWRLRDYGVKGQIGQEPLHDCGGWLTGKRCGNCYVCALTEVFHELRRCLRQDGTLWLNIADSYATGTGQKANLNRTYTGSLAHKTARAQHAGTTDKTKTQKEQSMEVRSGRVRFTGKLGKVSGNGRRPVAMQDAGWRPRKGSELKSGDLCGIPWRLAMSLQADGWYLRSDCIWCLSGGTWVYARTKKGIIVCMVRELYRNFSGNIELWNGTKWTQMVGITRNNRQGDELELVLRSGERISCTPIHRFPTQRGLLEASQMEIGDVIERCTLPEPENPRDCAIDEDAAWLAGLYLAEGSMSGNGTTIQISGHAKETARWRHVQRIVEKFGGSASIYFSKNGNGAAIHIRGKVLNAIIKELVSGRTAKDKGFAPAVWRYSNKFLASMLEGYLSGDGSYEVKNKRWRLAFTRNYNLERDLRTACARLGYNLTLKLATHKAFGEEWPSFRGELREERSGHHNEKDIGEVVEIRNARCRETYDLEVADKPHLFALASGVLTHNSQTNPTPESVVSRPARAHEYVLMLTKGIPYYDHVAVRQEAVGTGERSNFFDFDHTEGNKKAAENPKRTRNLWNVWTLPKMGTSEAHVAVYNPKLVEIGILSSTSARGCCPKCHTGWVRRLSRDELEGLHQEEVLSNEQEDSNTDQWAGARPWVTLGWHPNCECFGHFEETTERKRMVTGKYHTVKKMLYVPDGHQPDPVPAIVLDPFNGSGTTMYTAVYLGRSAVGIDISAEYMKIAKKRVGSAQPPWYTRINPVG